jgi:hypothetical protein
VTSDTTSNDSDWMFKPLGISQYYSTQPNKNCGDGGDE